MQPSQLLASSVLQRSLPLPQRHRALQASSRVRWVHHALLLPPARPLTQGAAAPAGRPQSRRHRGCCVRVARDSNHWLHGMVRRTAAWCLAARGCGNRFASAAVAFACWLHAPPCLSTPPRVSPLVCAAASPRACRRCCWISWVARYSARNRGAWRQWPLPSAWRRRWTSHWAATG